MKCYDIDKLILITNSLMTYKCKQHNDEIKNEGVDTEASCTGEKTAVLSKQLVGEFLSATKKNASSPFITMYLFKLNLGVERQLAAAFVGKSEIYLSDNSCEFD